MKKLIFLPLLILTLFLSGCADKTAFKKGHIKDDFCGRFLNFQYCKCAFHNDYCDAIGMKKGEAKKYVNEEYEKWVDSEFEKFSDNCEKGNGYMDGKSCVNCGNDFIAQGNECVFVDEFTEAQEEEGNEEEGEEEEAEEEGECKYDSECEAICEGDVMWKMGCNPRENKCIKTFETNCSEDKESFGELEFGKICSGGECVRDNASITDIKAELSQEKKFWSDTVKAINDTRADLNVAMLDANKNCINGIADMTNLAIVEFATRVGNVLAGGIPDVEAMAASAAEKSSGLLKEHTENLASAAVDYAGDALNRLNNYAQGTPSEEERKLKPHEYIKLNCDLYEYFKQVQEESGAELDLALQNAGEIDALLKELP